MSRLWIGLAMVLWLATYAPGADDPRQAPQSFPQAVTRPVERTPNARPAAIGASAERRAAAQPLLAPSEPGQRHLRVVVHLRNAPATQLAQTINTLFANEQRMGRSDEVPFNATIVPEMVSNCLVVSGKPEVVAEVRRLVTELDRAAVMIRLEVVLGDVPTASLPAAEAHANADPAKVQISPAGRELRKQMDVLFQAQLVTLDNQSAYLQAGRHEPTITAMNTTPMGRTNSLTVQNLGTKISITPRANAAGVVTMQLDVDDSRLAPAEEGVPIFEPDKGNPIRTPVSEVLSLKTTVKIADGQTVVLGGMSRPPKNGKQRVILITPHVLTIGGDAKPAK
jgi:type II secretory pathway component GspD/PulD (secretin)